VAQVSSHVSTPFKFSIDPLQGSGRLGFAFCAPLSSVHDAHVSTHPVLVIPAEHDVQLWA
jgi:hypothetical protein